jgi:RNA polymerase sigma factor (sigma-70 family)
VRTARGFGNAEALAVDESDARRVVDAVWAIESPRLIAGLMRVVRDVTLAEELAADAFVAALVQWPSEGVPAKPGAWLMAVAKRRAIDRIRREKTLARKHEEIGRDLRTHEDFEAAFDALGDGVGDDLLRLMFVAAHPVLSKDARVALMLRLLGGLSTSEIARAFLISEPAVAQRIVRAKRTLGEARAPFEVPDAPERSQRLGSVLEAIYLIFNEGYSASAGDDVMRPALCQEAMRLARVLAELVPHEPEAHGLVALLEIQASRFKARVDSSGDHVLLLDQDRGRWDYILIGRGLTALERAEKLGALGPYALQAAIAACHARARKRDDTDWKRIAALYDALAQLLPSPVIELNRAVAVGMAFGPASGLELVDALVDEPALSAYHLLPSVRGDLLEKLNRYGEARDEFDRAASLTNNARDRALLRERAAKCARA